MVHLNKESCGNTSLILYIWLHSCKKLVRLRLHYSFLFKKPSFFESDWNNCNHNPHFFLHFKLCYYIRHLLIFKLQMSSIKRFSIIFIHSPIPLSRLSRHFFSRNPPPKNKKIGHKINLVAHGEFSDFHIFLLWQSDGSLHLAWKTQKRSNRYMISQIW